MPFLNRKNPLSRMYGVGSTLSDRTLQFNKRLALERQNMPEAEPEPSYSQQMYALSAPSVRKTTESLMDRFTDLGQRTGRSPIELAGARDEILEAEVEGLGQAAGLAARTGVGLDFQAEQARKNRFQGLRLARLPYQKREQYQNESQRRWNQAWDEYKRITGGV